MQNFLNSELDFQALELCGNLQTFFVGLLIDDLWHSLHAMTSATVPNHETLCLFTKSDFVMDKGMRWKLTKWHSGNDSMLNSIRIKTMTLQLLDFGYGELQTRTQSHKHTWTHIHDFLSRNSSLQQWRENEALGAFGTSASINPKPGTPALWRQSAALSKPQPVCWQKEGSSALQKHLACVSSHL